MRGEGIGRKERWRRTGGPWGGQGTRESDTGRAGQCEDVMERGIKKKEEREMDGERMR